MVNDVEEEEQLEEIGQDKFVNAIGENHAEKLWFKIGDRLIELMIDSGSKFNIIYEKTWIFLNANQAEIFAVKPSNKKLVAYAQNEKLEVL